MGRKRVKTYLNVPYEASQRAKSLGARFDRALTLWFVPDGLDLYDFREWLAPELTEYWRKIGWRYA